MFMRIYFIRDHSDRETEILCFTVRYIDMKGRRREEKWRGGKKKKRVEEKKAG